MIHQIIEVIGTTVDDCINIQKGGASRIQLVSSLEVGGLTPSYGLITEVMAAVSIPVNVMIRPHSYSFCYSPADIRTMLADIKVCKELKVKGVVLGVLTADNLIDEENLAVLLEECEGLDVTFHKAFDQLKDQQQGLETLKKHPRIKTVLTQGGKRPIMQNLDHLRHLIQRRGSIDILLGGGLTLTNIAQIKQKLQNHHHHFGTAVKDPTRKKIEPHLVAEIVKLVGI